MLLPLVPVTAAIGALRKRLASSISPITGIPRPVAARSKIESRGTPGLVTTRSMPSIQAGSSAPSFSVPAGSRGALDADMQISHHEFRAARGKEPRRGDSADSQSHDHHALVRQFHQRSLSVLSAISAHTIDAIQNLMTTTVSGMPLSSK